MLSVIRYQCLKIVDLDSKYLLNSNIDTTLKIVDLDSTVYYLNVISISIPLFENSRFNSKY